MVTAAVFNHCYNSQLVCFAGGNKESDRTAERGAVTHVGILILTYKQCTPTISIFVVIMMTARNVRLYPV